MVQNIPITLTATPVPVGVQAVNMDDLMAIIADSIGGSISADVSFFIQGAAAPSSDQGIFYNTDTRRFEDWNSSLGSYTPVSELQVGDLKAAIRTTDDLANGWVLLNGRAFNNTVMPSLTQVQRSNLLALFTSGVLPTYSFLSGLSGLPANTAITGISNPPAVPSAGTISSLPIGELYSQLQVQALRDQTEILSGSNTSVQAATTSLISATSTILAVLNNTNAVVGPRWFVFCGYPT